jgi:hypothetical protein
MKKLLVFLLVVVVAAGGVAYWRGWISFGKDKDDGKPGIHVEKEKFKKDKDAFKQAASKKLSALKDMLTRKKNESKDLTGEAKAKKQKEIDDLEKKHKELDTKVNSLDDVKEDDFDKVKGDLNKDLDDVATPKGKGSDKPD